MSDRLSVSLGSVRLKNPVIPASGTFGFGEEMAALYDLNCLGAISFKGTTREARYGNPLPRIAECGNYGMINAVGLQNPGIDEVIEKQLPMLERLYSGPIIANVSGFSVDDYCYVCGKLDAKERVSIIEVNISCPNVHNGGMAFGTTPEAAAEVTRAVRKVTNKPIYIKLSPNVTDIVSIARACVDAGADGLCLINTVLGMRIDIRRRRPVIANRYGGYSGRGIFPIALRMVNQVAVALNRQVPIIGCGGIETAEDVVEMMMAGASAVEVGAANLHNPMACPEIIDRLPALLDELKIQQIQDITGCCLS
ncbi:MAG: dihydroorotate dehydrogenase [Paludibacteraceae bacterium]|nr:dihydroorotate dehydrogenase [Paludibacteraceae bacterium]